MYKGTASIATFDIGSEASAKGTEVSGTPSWTVESGSTVTISNEDLSNGYATALITSSSNNTGCNLIRITAAMENGEIIPGYLRVNVIEPSCEDC